jgi:hypothetical protein
MMTSAFKWRVLIAIQLKRPGVKKAPDLQQSLKIADLDPVHLELFFVTVKS